MRLRGTITSSARPQYLDDDERIIAGVEIVVGTVHPTGNGKPVYPAERQVRPDYADVFIAADSVQLEADVDISSSSLISGDVGGHSRSRRTTNEPRVTDVEVGDEISRQLYWRHDAQHSVTVARTGIARLKCNANKLYYRSLLLK